MDPILALLKGRQEEPATPPVPEAQRDDMLSRTRHLLGDPGTIFKQLDFVVFREGLGPFTKHYQSKIQMMFWEYIDTDDEFIKAKMIRAAPGNLNNYPTVDCVICYLEEGGLTFDLTWSPMLVIGKVEDQQT